MNSDPQRLNAEAFDRSRRYSKMHRFVGGRKQCIVCSKHHKSDIVLQRCERELNNAGNRLVKMMARWAV